MGGTHRWRGGLLDRDDAFVTGQLAHRDRAHRLNVVEGYVVGDGLRHVAETVVYGGGRDAPDFGLFL